MGLKKFLLETQTGQRMASIVPVGSSGTIQLWELPLVGLGVGRAMIWGRKCLGLALFGVGRKLVVTGSRGKHTQGLVQWKKNVPTMLGCHMGQKLAGWPQPWGGKEGAFTLWFCPASQT